jgi:FkbM family methyltransferase
MRILVITYIYIHYLLNKVGVKFRGLGKIQKLLKRKYIFTIRGKKFLFSPGIEGSYDYLLIKKSNEPETILLFSKVFSKLGESNFIDVGASVGEFVTYVSSFKNVINIFAFEPRHKCAEVLRKNAILNKDERIIVLEKALSNCQEQIPFFFNQGGSSSGFFKTHESQSSQFTANTVTMDSVVNMELKSTVLLIDVEGSEPNVLRGAKKFIEKNNPLIIFEYNNQISQKYFHLDDIKRILGRNYDFYRLNKKENLDSDFSNTWNCVAIPKNSVFSSILQSSIINN